MLVVGLMSGTSGDGVDVALARITEPDRRAAGTPRVARVRAELVAHVTLPLETRVRAQVLRVAEGGPVSAGELSQLNFRLGEVFAECILAACRRFRVAMSRVELIGSHGQTVFHQGPAVPFLGLPTRSTLQIGEGAVIAARTGVHVVSDFRAADMAAGGQGAPLVPFVDRILLGDPRKHRVALNLGGIGNLTVLPAARSRKRSDPPGAGPRKAPGTGIVAFDTGPGNMVIDALVSHFTRGRKRFDEDGRIAAQGQVNGRVLAELMKDEYLRVEPPKSTGREYYGAAFLDRVLRLGKKFGCSPDDLVRTATAFTAAAVADAFGRFVLPGGPIDEVIVSGGGAHNPVLLRELAALLAPSTVLPSSVLGIDVDAKEAFAFAILAFQTWHRRVGNLPEATGASRGVILGKISYA